MKNKIIDINNEYVTIQASNCAELFIIDRFIYDNFWDNYLSKYSWLLSSKSICDSKGISLKKKILELYNIESNNRYICLKNKSSNKIHDLRLDNIRPNINEYNFIDENSCICKLYNSNTKFIFDRCLYENISKYPWYDDTNGGGHRIRAYVNNNHISLKNFILNLYNLNDINDIKTTANIIKYYDKDNNIIYDFRIQNILYRNNVININDNYVFIKSSNTKDIFIIDRFIYDLYWNDILSKYSWYAHDKYIKGWINNRDERLHRFILIILGIDISNYSIHHINLNSFDNSLENLYICSADLHSQIHGLIYSGNYIELKSNVIECINNNGVVPDKYSLSLNDILYNYNTVKPKIIKPFLFIE